MDDRQLDDTNSYEVSLRVACECKWPLAPVGDGRLVCVNNHCPRFAVGYVPHVELERTDAPAYPALASRHVM